MNVGIVGIRGYGATYLRALAARPNDRAVALCDLDRAAVDTLADAHGVPGRFQDFNEMLATPGLDAVCIATPHFLHHPMAMAALAAGKHVFCEKPLAIESAHADELARTARARGLTLTCHYNQRTRPYVAQLRQIVRSGLVGRPYHVNARWMARWTSFMFDATTSWRLQQAKSGGGIFIGRGSHLVDAVLYILGFPRVLAVSATMHRPLTGGEVDDFASATLRLDGGATLNVQCSYVAHAAAFEDRMEYEIYGTEGGASYASGGRVTVGRTSMADGTWQDLTDAAGLDESGKPEATTIVDDFLDAIADRREPLVTGEQAAAVARVIEAAYASAASGREVAIAHG